MGRDQREHLFYRIMPYIHDFGTRAAQKYYGTLVRWENSFTPSITFNKIFSNYNQPGI